MPSYFDCLTHPQSPSQYMVVGHQLVILFHQLSSSPFYRDILRSFLMTLLETIPALGPLFSIQLQQAVNDHSYNLRKIRLLTFNVWRAKWCFVEARARQIVRIIKKSMPDVICLQEVTRVAYAILRQALGEMYAATPPSKCGIVTLFSTRLTLKRTRRIAFRSNQARFLSWPFCHANTFLLQEFLRCVGSKIDVVVSPL